MSTLGTAAAVIVGVAFVVAGGSKLAAGPGWPAMARDLGAPAAVVPVLPWLELGVGAALVAQLLVPGPAVAAIVLLVAFTVLIGLRLREGRRPPCACFGAWSARPLGAGHLVRNAVLTALAVLALWA